MKQCSSFTHAFQIILQYYNPGIPYNLYTQFTVKKTTLPPNINQQSNLNPPSLQGTYWLCIVQLKMQHFLKLVTYLTKKRDRKLTFEF